RRVAGCDRLDAVTSGCDVAEPDRAHERKLGLAASGVLLDDVLEANGATVCGSASDRLFQIKAARCWVGPASVWMQREAGEPVVRAEGPAPTDEDRLVERSVEDRCAADPNTLSTGRRDR